MSFLGTLIGGGAGFLLGGPVGAFLGAGMGSGFDASKDTQSGIRSTNAMNLQLGREQMQFQERMSDTQYQRGVKDMEAAGLNPMLAYSQGGASSPSGSLPVMQNPVPPGASSASGAMQGLNSSLQVLGSKAAIEKVQADTDMVRSQTMSNALNSAIAGAQLDKLRTETYTSDVAGRLGEQQTKTERERTNIAALEAQRNDLTFSADVAKRKAESKLTEMEIPRSAADAEFYQKLGTLNPYLRMLLQVVTGARQGALFLQGK